MAVGAEEAACTSQIVFVRCARSHARSLAGLVRHSQVSDLCRHHQVIEPGAARSYGHHQSIAARIPDRQQS